MRGEVCDWTYEVAQIVKISVLMSCSPEIKLHREYTHESSGLDISQAPSLVTLVYERTRNRASLVVEVKAFHGPKA